MGLHPVAHGLQGGRIEQLTTEQRLYLLWLYLLCLQLTTEERVTWVAPQLSSATCTQTAQGGLIGWQPGCTGWQLGCTGWLPWVHRVAALGAQGGSL